MSARRLVGVCALVLTLLVGPGVSTALAVDNGPAEADPEGESCLTMTELIEKTKQAAVQAGARGNFAQMRELCAALRGLRDAANEAGCEIIGANGPTTVTALTAGSATATADDGHLSNRLQESSYWKGSSNRLQAG